MNWMWVISYVDFFRNKVIIILLIRGDEKSSIWYKNFIKNVVILLKIRFLEKRIWCDCISYFWYYIYFDVMIFLK